MNKKRIFFDFLQKHNALKAYKRAFKASVLGSPFRTADYVPLVLSFVWANTPEGQEYWRRLDEKWYYHYRSIKKKYHF